MEKAFSTDAWGDGFDEEAQKRVERCVKELIGKIHGSYVETVRSRGVSSVDEQISILQSACMSVLSDLASQSLGFGRVQRIAYAKNLSMAISGEFQKRYGRPKNMN